MRKPETVTITGLDEKTDLDIVVAISAEYPQVEWGVLYSRKLSGIGRRYPGPETIREIESMPKQVKLSVHLCGAVGRQLLDGMIPSDVRFERYGRTQINASGDEIERGMERAWDALAELSVIPIVQWRRSFWPEDRGVQPLFDRSGGRGELPGAWPLEPLDPDYIVGYAGGLSPENVAGQIKLIGSDGRYWIDAETHLRDDRDFLDLEKCQAFLRAVYG